MVDDIKILSGKEALEYWILEADRRDANNQSFRDEEVMFAFGSYEKLFGLEQAKVCSLQTVDAAK